MINYGKVRSTVEPEPIVVDEFSIWVYSNIKPIEEKDEQVSFNGFEYDLVRYDKDEYIKILSEKNIKLESQLTETQLALAEIYEGVPV